MSTLPLTTAEASALLNMPDRKIWGEIERVFEGLSTPPRLPLDCIVYLKALAELDSVDPSVEGRKRFYIRISNVLLSNAPLPDDLPLTEAGGTIRFNIRLVVESIKERLDAFDRWKAERVVKDPTILAGEPVFRGSRLSIRNIGLRAAKDSIATILEDYSYLTSDDVLFAAQYAKAYPRLGRPREAA